MAAAFNAVTRLRHVPATWNISTTILIHKKGPRNEVDNWRPIALSNTASKIYTSVLAARLRRWADANDRISRSQKGFATGIDGCGEHNYTVQAAIGDARSKRRECCIAWLDLRNAFGNVPHGVIFSALRWAGLDDSAIEVIRRLYERQVTAIRTVTGLTPLIPIRTGVKQGCPLSPTLFNLVIEPLLRTVALTGAGYSMHGVYVPCVAYADDLALLAPDPVSLQNLLDAAAIAAEWSGLQFNLNKCATLHVIGALKKAPRTHFNVQGATLPALGEEEYYQHLGVPTGFHRVSSATDELARLHADVAALDRSLLAPWQKLDATATLILTRLTFHMTNGHVEKEALTAADEAIKRAAKKWLYLPQRAGAEVLYLNCREGGAALLPLNPLAEACQLAHAVRILGADGETGVLALAHLNSCVASRIGARPDPRMLAEYLNAGMKGRLARETKDPPSTWSRARTATGRLGKYVPRLKWRAAREATSPPALTLNGSPLAPGQVEQSLRAAIRAHFRERLLSKPDQGKVHHLTYPSPPSNHFMKAGNFTRFAEWRFIHRARLGCVPLNATQRFGYQRNERCRRCGYARETLPHVMCHCLPHMVAITRRHDAILARLAKATPTGPGTEVRINRAVPGMVEAVRPDLVVLNRAKSTATVVDVTCPFENGRDAFATAAATKLAKYQAVEDHLRATGYESVSINAFIIGPMGGWWAGNEQTLKRLGVRPTYSNLMRQLMVSDVVRWSRDIYVEHLTGVRQYQ